ncbi:hypothetical protein PSTT_10378 [Puccinia striiformis]|uniref:Uncharacterized protein n=1 Tax=Puccinia striiformis TaxID=27350 RepID=A0A2S4V4R7_9BASI|nr:hypothetical protein PSTT_10378 [Puccinia striiformis]
MIAAKKTIKKASSLPFTVFPITSPPGESKGSSCLSFPKGLLESSKTLNSVRSRLALKSLIDRVAHHHLNIGPFRPKLQKLPVTLSQCPKAAMNITYLGTCFLVIATMLGNSDASGASTPKKCKKTIMHEKDKCWTIGCTEEVSTAKWRLQCDDKNCAHPVCSGDWTPTKAICFVCLGNR